MNIMNLKNIKNPQKKQRELTKSKMRKEEEWSDPKERDIIKRWNNIGGIGDKTSKKG